MDVIEEIIKFRKDLDDAKKEIKGISGKNKKSAPAEKNFQSILAPFFVGFFPFTGAS